MEQNIVQFLPSGLRPLVSPQGITVPVTSVFPVRAVQPGD